MKELVRSTLHICRKAGKGAKVGAAHRNLFSGGKQCYAQLILAKKDITVRCTWVLHFE